MTWSIERACKARAPTTLLLERPTFTSALTGTVQIILCHLTLFKWHFTPRRSQSQCRSQLFRRSRKGAVRERCQCLLRNLRRKLKFKPLEYDSSLVCCDCQCPALVKYFSDSCDHVVCVFCKPTHACKAH